MAQFEIWYAVENTKKFLVLFTKNKNEILCHAQDGYSVKEFVATLVTTPLKHVALIENGAIVSIMAAALADQLYEDQSNLHPVLLTPITRCEKCRIMYVDNVFYWDYVSETRGRQAATPEQVLAKVCIPTAGHGDRQHIPCLAKQLHESDLGLLQKTPAELHDFVRANNNAIEFELPDEDYYLKMAKEILNDEL